MHFLNLINNELMYGGLTKEEFNQIIEPVEKHNHKNLIIWLVAVTLFWFSNLLTYNKPDPHETGEDCHCGSLRSGFLRTAE